MITQLTHDREYDVLNTIALKKMADADQIASATTLAAAIIVDTMETLSADGLIVLVGTSALPTDEAVPALSAFAAQRYSALRDDPEVLEMADRFEVVNGQFLTTISAWQQIDVGGRKVTNDHTDADYDGKVLDRLDKLVRRLQRLIATLEHRDERFAAYVRRFDTAADAVASGDVELVSSPTRDSVHNVWFEFHEDLLRTLGRARKE